MKTSLLYTIVKGMSRGICATFRINDHRVRMTSCLHSSNIVFFIFPVKCNSVEIVFVNIPCFTSSDKYHILWMWTLFCIRSTRLNLNLLVHKVIGRNKTCQNIPGHKIKKRNHQDMYHIRSHDSASSIVIVCVKDNHLFDTSDYQITCPLLST